MGTRSALSRALAAGALAGMVLAASPGTSPAQADPGSAAATPSYLDGPEPYPGFSSPYIGHNGFRNIPLDFSDYEALDMEDEMGLHWSFMAVVWAGFEPVEPTTAADDPTGAWATLDEWVAACRERGINLLIQPVMSGNGVTVPPWSGLRTPIGYNQPQTWVDPSGERHHDGAFFMPGIPRAPRRMNAAAEWIGKLVARYKPGGELAQERGWTDGYGVRAWEIENEPDAWGVWLGQLDDYAELVVRAQRAIKAEDPLAVVMGPAISGTDALRTILDRRMQSASLEYKLNEVQYAIGPFVDVASFHNYERLDFEPVEDAFAEQKAWWNLYAGQPGFEFAPDKEYWVTEGGLDFGAPDDDAHMAARWFPQYFARGFGAGIDRLIVTAEGDGVESVNAQRAAATFMRLLPDPFPMEKVSSGAAHVYRHGGAVWTYIAWAPRATTTVSLPVRTASARVIDKYGNERTVTATGGAVEVTLRQASSYGEPIYVVEAPG